MRWVHGELACEDGLVTQFRYAVKDSISPVDFIKTIQEKYARGSTVLWIEEGFTPSDTARWDKWLLEEPEDLSECVAEFRELW
jgi:hypothetical protein